MEIEMNAISKYYSSYGHIQSHSHASFHVGGFRDIL